MLTTKREWEKRQRMYRESMLYKIVSSEDGETKRRIIALHNPYFYVLFDGRLGGNHGV